MGCVGCKRALTFHAYRLSMIRSLIAMAVRRARREVSTTWVVNADDQMVFKRFHFLREDEFVGGKGHVYFKLPWWQPFNAMLYCWRPPLGVDEEMHDHPRWTITVCLAGELIEETPWGRRVLRPGAVVIRSRKAIHRFIVHPRHRGRTWTLFIVGRRKYEQHWYAVRTFPVIQDRAVAKPVDDPVAMAV